MPVTKPTQEKANKITKGLGSTGYSPGNKPLPNTGTVLEYLETQYKNLKHRAKLKKALKRIKMKKGIKTARHRRNADQMLKDIKKDIKEGKL